MGRAVCKYTLAEKLNILEEVTLGGASVKATAKKYEVSPNNIRIWRKKLSRERVKQPNRKILVTTSRRKDTEVFDHLDNFFLARRERDICVTVRHLVREARRCFPQFMQDLSSKTTAGRIRRWLKDKRISLRRVTHRAQNTRYTTLVMVEWIANRTNENMISRYCATLIADWVGTANSLISRGGYVPDAVVNMDETNFDFDDSRMVTLERVGARTVNGRATKSCKRASVLLAVSQAGEKLPPFIIFQGKRHARIHREVTTLAEKRGYPASVVMSVQANAWNDGELMLEWVKRVYKPWMLRKQLSKSLLILDDFRGHWVTPVTDALSAINTEPLLVPKGYTAKLQVLDVGINRPFHDHTLDCIDDWLMDHYDEETGRIPNPDRVSIAQHVAKAWTAVQPSAIVNTFRHIGLRPLHEPVVAVVVGSSSRSDELEKMQPYLAAIALGHQTVQ